MALSLPSQNLRTATRLVETRISLTGAFAFDSSNAELRAKFEKVIECMKADGTVAAIHEKWTGQKPIEGGAAYKVEPGIGVPGMPGYDETASDSGC